MSKNKISPQFKNFPSKTVPFLFSRKGFSLVEVLIALSISLIIALATYACYSIASRLSSKENKSVELVQNGRVAMDRLTREIRQSQDLAMVIPATPDDPSDPPPSEIIFQDGHSLDSIKYIRYYLDNLSLHRELSHYAFSASPDDWTYWNAVDASGNPAQKFIDSDEIIAEHLEVLKFWGQNKMIFIYLKNSLSAEKFELRTGVYCRNSN